MNPKFEPTDDGLEIIDPIERRRYRLTTHEPVAPTPVETDRIQFPVTTAVEITTEMITLPTNESVYVRDEGGSMISEVRPNKQATLPPDTYTLDLSGPLKVYARVESSVYIYSDSDRTYITLDEGTRTTLGARSYHRRPAGTITTTAEPSDVMRAVSAFGSALKSTTPERSYPTHRGHPPAVELGDELEIPDEFERPETGIRIEVPQDLGDVLVVTPLAYYLGAEVVPGSKPRLVTDEGFTCDLRGDDGLETTVGRVLKQVFFLDCVVRTEGPTPLPLHERRVLEPELEFDIKRVYDQPLVEQLETYLSTPFETVGPYIPDWQPQTRLDVTDDIVRFLPFVVDNLSIIKIDNGSVGNDRSDKKKAIGEFTRNDFVRSASPIRGSKSESLSELETETIQQSWAGIDSSKITSTTPLSAFHHTIDQKPREDPIEIQVVCNDLEMREELEIVDGVYGNRDDLPFNVTLHYGKSVEELKYILAKETDFIHFIGHIDDGGFQCSDGKLNAELISETGAKVFFLNACQSYEQGIQLVESGSIGGIVTLHDVINDGAVKIGCTMARLLNRGFPLYAAIDVAQRSNIAGHQYSIVGNGLATIAQTEAAPPTICAIDEVEDTIDVEVITYLGTKYRKGSVFIPYLSKNEEYFLTSGNSSSFAETRSTVEDLLSMEQLPIISNGELRWSEDIVLDDL